MGTEKEGTLERRTRLLGSGLRIFYDFPFHPVRGKGAWLFDVSGKAYLDAYNNVPHVGHCHPHVTAAMARQAGAVNTNTRYLHETILDYAERLITTLPATLDSCIFVCTGTEANDLAWRLAKAYTGGDGAICSANAYHGNSDRLSALHGAIKSNANVSWVARIPPPGVVSRNHENDLETGKKIFADHVDGAVEKLRSAGHSPAVAYFDTVFANDGLHIPINSSFMNLAIDRLHANNALLVADEVQAGFGRTGTDMWGFQALGIAPDIVTMGKPAGNGYPIGIVVTRREIVSKFFENERYFNTFGGNPVACAAGIAVLEVLEQEKLQDNARKVGAYMKEALKRLAAKHDRIAEVRGCGLFLGVELATSCGSHVPAAALAHKVMNDMARQGVLVGLTGPDRTVLKIRPPMVFSERNADQLVQTLDRVLMKSD